MDPALLFWHCLNFESPRNDPWICERAQGLRAAFPDIACDLVLRPDEIKRKHEVNRGDVALCGTYMHILFEAHLNCFAVPKTSPEFAMLEVPQTACPH
jgi:hypothetical protein